MSKRLDVLLGAVVVALLLAGALGYGAWRLVRTVEHGVLAAWTLLATMGLPIALYVGYRLGQTEARGTVSGLQTGLDAAVGAGRSIAEVKVGAARRVRQVEPMPEVRLPVIDVTPRRLDGGDKVVDL